MRSAIALLISLTVSLPVYAVEVPSCMCRNGLAMKGDSQDEVETKCGKPARIRYNGYYRHGKYHGPAEEWVYNFGPQEFIHTVKFQDGKVVQVESQGYGWKTPNR